MADDFDFRDAATAPRPAPAARRVGGRRPEDILAPEEYLSYKHGRLLSGLLVFFAGWCVVGGLAEAALSRSDPKNHSAALAALLAAMGASGVVGGVAAFRGDRGWALAAYPFAALLVFGIPVGTAVSVLWFLGLSKHMAACERVRRAAAGGRDRAA